MGRMTNRKGNKMSKIRNGFVSNSSSSSFIISGISLEENDLARRLDISPEDSEENEIENGESLSEIIEDKLDKMGIDYYYDYDSNIFSIGVSLPGYIEDGASIVKEDIESAFKKAEKVLEEIIEPKEAITLLLGYREC